ncbi:MAG: nitrite reductase, partial [Pseudomonadota bacterium]
MQKMKLVMVGNGMAGVRTLEELLKIAPDLYDITVFGAEPHPNYNRILLSPVLAGEQTIDEIILNPLSWYADHGITLHLATKVTDVHRARRVVTGVNAQGETVEAEYDRLLIATGSNPFILPVPGKDLEGVIAYRDIADTNTMIETARTHQHAVVIGGGLLGLEAANGLMLRGMQVTVVHISDWLMERQLDSVAGKLLQKSLQDRGLKFEMGAQTAALIGDQDEGKGGRVADMGDGKFAQQFLAMRRGPFDPDRQQMGGNLLHHRIGRVGPIDHFAYRPRGIADEMWIAVNRLCPVNKTGGVQHGRHFGMPVLILPALILGQGQAALGRIAGLAQIGRERRQIVEGDVRGDVNAIGHQKFAQQ